VKPAALTGQSDPKLNAAVQAAAANMSTSANRNKPAPPGNASAQRPVKRARND